MKKTIIGILITSLTVGVHAQQPLTLEECITMAVENNANMRMAEQSVEGAIETKKAAYTNFFPSVSGSAIGMNANKGMLELQIQDKAMSIIKNGVGVGVTATQPLFAGGQIVNGHKLAGVGVDVSRLQKEQTEKEIRLTTEKYYWQVVNLKEKRATVVAIGLMLDKLNEDVSASVEAGVTTRNDLLQVQLKQNYVESSLIDLDNGIDLSKRVLAQYIGLGDTIVDVATTVDRNSPVPSPEEIRTIHSEALGQTTEYKLLSKDVQANQLQYKMEVGKHMPTLALGVGYMYNDFMEKDRGFGMVYATLSVPISDWWGGSHSIKQKKSKLKISQTQMDDNSQLLVLHMTQTWNALDNAYKQIAIADKSIEQAEENLRLHSDYYAAGTTSMSDLLEAQSLYQQSRDKYVEAWTKYQVCRMEYLQATGR